MIHKTLPDADTLIQHETDFDELLYVADYFNIPVFIDLFTKLKNAMF